MRILIIYILILGRLTCFGQNRIFSNISFRMGYSQSSQSPMLYRPDQVSYWYRNIHAPYFALNYSDSLNRKLGYSLGLQFCAKGFQTHYEFDYSPTHLYVKYRYSLYYLELPVNLIFNFKSFKINTGLVASYLFDSTEDFYHSYVDKYYVNDYIFSDQNLSRFNRLDLGITLGILKKINQHVDLELTFQRGLIVPDKWTAGEINYQETGLIGIRYYFLKKSTYLTDSD